LVSITQQFGQDDNGKLIRKVFDHGLKWLAASCLKRPTNTLSARRP
jgi:hypothetical protein